MSIQNLLKLEFVTEGIRLSTGLMTCRMSLLICFALKEEAAPFRKIAAGKPGISILLTGIGRQNAEKSVREFLAGGASVPASRLQDVRPAKTGSSVASPHQIWCSPAVSPAD